MESLVVLATVFLLVFITIPVLKVYVLKEKSGAAPVYIERRGTENSPTQLPDPSDDSSEAKPAGKPGSPE